jgi:hypothetical protein
MEQSHAKLLTQAARASLQPLGVVQRDQSSTWLDDRQWFVTVIEFQPSSWSKGTYLNVGAHFLWRWGGDLSFDLGQRIESLVAYESDAQFAPEADRLAARAAAEVLSFRERLPVPSAAAAALPESPAGRGWPLYHRAVALGLSGEADAAAATFQRLALADGDDHPWVGELRQRCGNFAALVADPQAFRGEIRGLIVQQRATLKLPEVDGVLPE